MKLIEIPKTRILEYRRQKWNGGRNGSLHTVEQMASFLNDVSMALIFGSRDIPLPKIYDCAAADADWWAWKDLLQAKKLAYNGRVVRHKATLISMGLLPAFLAVYLTGGGFAMYEEEYYWGNLSQLANQVAQYLDRKGPTATDVLRQAIMPKGKDHTRRYHAALFELQSKFKIVTVGLEDRSWGVRVLDLFMNWVPAKVERRAETMGREEAMVRILAAFVGTAGAVPERTLPRIFGWPSEEASRASDFLVSRQAIPRGRVRGEQGTCLLSPTLL